jgi:hypothetical protein
MLCWAALLQLLGGEMIGMEEDASISRMDDDGKCTAVYQS